MLFMHDSIFPLKPDRLMLLTVVEVMFGKSSNNTHSLSLNSLHPYKGNSSNILYIGGQMVQKDCGCIILPIHT